MRVVARSLIVLLLTALSASAHESRPGYLEMRETTPDTYDVVWKVPARGDRRLSINLGFPEDTRVLAGPAASFSDNAYFERSRITRPGGLTGATIHIDGLESTQTDALIRITSHDGTTQTSRATPEQPTFVVEANPSGWQVAWTYLVLGVEHILLGIDHLLFVLALVLLVKGWRRLVETITAFTVAHSITLALATLGFVHVPGPPVEACIALSIVFVAAEIIRSREGRPGLTETSPWMIAFLFGLLHGLGFAGALSEVGLPEQAIPLALLFFNVGVELGQLAFVAAVLLLMRISGRILHSIAGRVATQQPSWSWKIAPYGIGILAMFWVIERTSGF